MSIQWLPFLVLYTIRFFKQSNNKNSGLVGIFAGLNMLSNAYFGLYSILIFITILCYNLLVKKVKLNRVMIKRLFFIVMVKGDIFLNYSISIFINYLGIDDVIKLKWTRGQKSEVR